MAMAAWISARATQRLDDAAEFDQQSVAGRLDQPAVMFGEFGIEQTCLEQPEALQRSFFIHADQPRIADNIGGEDCGKAARRHDQNAPFTAELADRQRLKGKERFRPR